MNPYTVRRSCLDEGVTLHRTTQYREIRSRFGFQPTVHEAYVSALNRVVYGHISLVVTELLLHRNATLWTYANVFRIFLFSLITADCLSPCSGHFPPVHFGQSRSPRCGEGNMMPLFNKLTLDRQAYSHFWLNRGHSSILTSLWVWYFDMSMRVLDVNRRHVFYYKHSVAMTEFFLRLQMVTSHLGAINRERVCLDTRCWCCCCCPDTETICWA
jgi:hypothetical protein